MLFVKRRDVAFERPKLGGPAYTNWSLEPIEIVDGVPFAITWGYSYFGTPPKPDEYVYYCMSHCDWTDAMYSPKTLEQKQAALDKLVKLPNWQQSPDQNELDFLNSQIR